MLSPEDRQRIHEVLATLATFRLRMKEAGETAAKLGINFRDLEREAERLYDNLREMIHSAKNGGGAKGERRKGPRRAR